MSKIRRAHSVELIMRRFSDAELGEPEPMEIVGLHDELARIERKWLMQIAEGSERRQPGDPKRLDLWYERLQRLIERSLRKNDLDASVAPLLHAALARCVSRQKVTE